ncbi:wax ester/triacylglycerol synthase domain-containing protein [Streptomyces sp. NPDC052693]|uniref:wax ester/triacylglycerol synthase domain-containing protein n=1 Tax=Streptomyces sp. NPDC052693 TaxID=3155814 RepID=UPI0034152E2F
MSTHPAPVAGPVDRVFLETGTTCGYVLDFDGVAPHPERFAEHVLRRAASFTSLRLLPPPPGRHRWRMQSEPLSGGAHVRTRDCSTQPGGTTEATDALLNQALAGDPHPPWDVWLLHVPGRKAFRIVYRVHHALQDGASAAHVMLGLLSDQVTAGPRPHRAAAPTVRGALLAGQSFLTALRFDGTWPVLRATPAHRTHWIHADVSEARLREVAARHDATVNDVCLAGLACALGHWYRTVSGALPNPRELVVLVPMSVRKDSDRYAVGSRVTAHHVGLRLGLSDLGRAVRSVHEQTRALRPHRVRDASRLALGLLPPALGHRMAGVTLGRTAAPVLTSSITLPSRFTCLGGRLSAASLVCDLFGGRLCYISFTRAAGVLRCGIVADEALPEARALPGLWRDAVTAGEQSIESVTA